MAEALFPGGEGQREMVRGDAHLREEFPVCVERAKVPGKGGIVARFDEEAVEAMLDDFRDTPHPATDHREAEPHCLGVYDPVSLVRGGHREDMGLLEEGLQDLVIHVPEHVYSGIEPIVPDPPLYFPRILRVEFPASRDG